MATAVLAKENVNQTKKDTIIGVQNSIIDISVYVDAINVGLSEIFELSMALENYLTEKDGQHPPYIQEEAKRLNSFLTLVELPYSKLKEEVAKADKLSFSLS